MGQSSLEINCDFRPSRHCRIVEEDGGMQRVTRRRVVCGPTLDPAP